MSARFDVSDVSPVEEEGEEESAGAAARLNETKGSNDVDGKVDYLNLNNVERNQLTVTSVASANLALYEEELHKRPKISVLLSGLMSYDPVQPNPSQMKGKGKKKKKASLGTIMGVYLPTLQNILGVILFLRLSWIVGQAGMGMAFFIVTLCCVTTLLTAISLSAIATNGHVPAGGAYFMISRNLGPEFGGAVGILFYLATTFATSLYVVGAIELLLTYILPQISLFGPIVGNPTALFNNIRVYGTILLLLMTIIVFVGVKIVNWFATVCLVVVLIAVASLYAGAFNPTDRVVLCTVDGAALQAPPTGPYSCNAGTIQAAMDELDCIINASVADPTFQLVIIDNETMNVTIPGMSFDYLDFDANGTDCNLTVSLSQICFPGNPDLRKAFNGSIYLPVLNKDWAMPPTCIVGIPGIDRVSNTPENTPQGYLKTGEIRPGVQGQAPQVRAEITASFFVLIGIFFPSVTGIMAGSNRSGDLKDAQKSIPIGTIAAILTTSLIYMTCVLFFGGTIRRFLLVDQLGYAAGLTVSLLAWPSKWVILIGALLSTIGAGLQSLTGAPRLMQAIANDNLISFLNFFKRTGLNGEPSFALVLTFFLAEIGVVIASLDLVAPILTMFFLICYMFVNFATTLQSFLKSPNWRPRFRYFHWTLSLVGALLCLTMMFLVSWYYALAALAVAVIIYKYIEYRGAEKEWGDGVTGLSLQAARYSLLKLEEDPPHTKNWRPQVLVLCRLDQNLIPSHPKLLSFASQLKAGKGLMLIYSILEGSYTDITAQVMAAKQSLTRFKEDNKIQGFTKVIAAEKTVEGVSSVIQGAGLGGMKHNTVLISWPDSWRRSTSWSVFIEAIRVASASELAVLVPKGINWYPSNEDRYKGTMDVWWVVHDGGLLMLLPFLLLQHKSWRRCQLRIFAVAQVEDNSIQMKKDLAVFLYQLRIPAIIDVIEMPDDDISAYTYERTLVMEQRNEMLSKLRLSKRQKKGDVQHLLARSFSRRGFSAVDAPLSPPGEFSIPVPQFPRIQTPPHQGNSPLHSGGLVPGVLSADDVSIGDLSMEPRVLGLPSLSEDIDGEKEEERKAAAEEEEKRHAPSSSAPPPEGDGVRRRSGSNSSGSESDDDSERSVQTPLLEQHMDVADTVAETLFVPDTVAETLFVPPAIPRPASLLRYDEMFGDEDTQLGGTAEPISAPHEDNVRRMNTAVKLNELMVTKSHDASLVIVNLPGPPKMGDEETYMEFLDVLTEGLDRVLMVRGGGREVITVYS